MLRPPGSADGGRVLVIPRRIGHPDVQVVEITFAHGRMLLTDRKEDSRQVPSGQNALEELELLRAQLFLQVCQPIQLPEPEPDPVLDLGSKRGSEVRMFKLLYQQSLLHRENFASATQIKHLYLIDAYLDLAKSQNGLALVHPTCISPTPRTL